MRTALLSLALLLAACNTSAVYQTVPMPDQSVELEDASHGRVYIIREGQTLWRRFPLRIYEAETEIGSLGTGTYLCWEREAGRLLVRLILDRPWGEGGPIEQLYDAHIEAGKVRWVRVGVDTNDNLLTTTDLEAQAGNELVANSQAAEAR